MIIFSVYVFKTSMYKSDKLLWCLHSSFRSAVYATVPGYWILSSSAVAFRSIHLPGKVGQQNCIYYIMYNLIILNTKYYVLLCWLCYLVTNRNAI